MDQILHAPSRSRVILFSFERFQGLLLILTGLVALFFLVEAVRFLPVRSDNMYPEAAGVLSAQRWAHGLPLYEDYRQPPYMTASFPPAWYGVLALAAKLGLQGLNKLTLFGRLLSLGCLFGVGWLGFRWNRKIGLPFWLALLTPLFYLSLPILIPWAVTARPDFPGLLLVFLSLYVISLRPTKGSVLLAAAFAAVIIAVISSLALITVRQRNLARAAEDTNHRQLYAAHMNLAARDWQDSGIQHMRDLLAVHVPDAGQADLRGFEWYLLWALAHPERKTLLLPGEFQWLVFSPDRSMFATCEEADVKLWDMATGEQLRTFNTVGLRGAAGFSPDGKLLAAEGPDHSIALWDLNADRELHHLKGHTNEITELRFSGDGKMLASTSRDHTARLWDVGTGNLHATLVGHTDAVYSIALSPDGKKVATASDDLTVRLWGVVTGKQLMTLEHPTTRQSNSSRIHWVVFSPDGSRILATGLFMNIAVWDAVSGEALPALEGHRSFATPLAFSPDGKLMATGSDDRTILLWDVGTWSVIKRLTGHGNRIAELAFSRDSKTLISAARDRTIKLWDVAADPNPLERPGAQLVAYSSDGRTLVSVYRSDVKLWDTATWKVVNTLQERQPRIFSLAYSPDDKTLAFGTESNTVSIWDVAAGKERFVLNGHSDQVRSVAYSPDGKLLATASLDKTIRLWDAATGEELAKLELSEALVVGVAFSPDGALLASANWDATIKLWDVATRRLLTILKGHTSAIRNVAFSPDGKLLASTSNDSSIKLWDVATRKELFTLKGHAGNISALAFSPDGNRLASGGEDSAVRLWDVATGQELAALRRHAYPVLSLAFSPDGKTLVSADRDGHLNVWLAATEEEVQDRDN